MPRDTTTVCLIPSYGRYLVKGTADYAQSSCFTPFSFAGKGVGRI